MQLLYSPLKPSILIRFFVSRTDGTVSVRLLQLVVLVFVGSRRAVMTHSIPVIDLSLAPNLASDALFHAASNYGFFYLENHSVSPKDMNQALELNKALFHWYPSSEVFINVHIAGKNEFIHVMYLWQFTYT